MRGIERFYKSNCLDLREGPISHLDSTKVLLFQLKFVYSEFQIWPQNENPDFLLRDEKLGLAFICHNIFAYSLFVVVLALCLFGARFSERWLKIYILKNGPSF